MAQVDDRTVDERVGEVVEFGVQIADREVQQQAVGWQQRQLGFHAVVGRFGAF
jgi:hypothetical protein